MAYEPRFGLRQLHSFVLHFGIDITQPIDFASMAMIYDDGGIVKKVWCPPEVWNTRGPFDKVLSVGHARRVYDLTPKDYEGMEQLPLNMYPIVFPKTPPTFSPY